MTHTVQHDAHGNVTGVELRTANGWLIRVTEDGAELFRPYGFMPPTGGSLGAPWPLHVRDDRLSIAFPLPPTVNESPGKGRT